MKKILSALVVLSTFVTINPTFAQDCGRPSEAFTIEHNNRAIITPVPLIGDSTPGQMTCDYYGRSINKACININGSCSYVCTFAGGIYIPAALGSIYSCCCR